MKTPKPFVGTWGIIFFHQGHDSSFVASKKKG